MTEWSENDANNVDSSNQDNLDATIENNQEQEDCDNDLNQSMNPFDHNNSHCPQNGLGKCSTISPKSLPITDIDKLKCTPQVSIVKFYKIQYLQVDHPGVYYYIPHTVFWWLDRVIITTLLL